MALAWLLVVDAPLRVLAQTAAAAGGPSDAALANAAWTRAASQFPNDGGGNWPAMQHPDGGVTVRSPDGNKAVVARPSDDGTRIELAIYERKGRLVEITRLENGVWLTVALSGQSGTVAPAGPPLDIAPGEVPPPEPAPATLTEPVIPPPEREGGEPVQRMVALADGVQVPGAANPGVLGGTLASFGLPATPDVPSRATGTLTGVGAKIVPLPTAMNRAWSEGVMRDLRESSRFFSGDKDADGRHLGANRAVIAPTTLDALEAVRRYLEKNAAVLADEFPKMRNLPRAEKVKLLENLIARSADVRQAFNEFKQAEALFQVNEPANQQRYENGLAELTKLEEAGQTELADEMHEKVNNEVYPRYVRARARYIGLLDANPLLGIKVDGEFLYDALASVPQTANPSGSITITTANQQNYVDLLNAALAVGETQVREQATRFGIMRAVSDLAELATPRYAAVHRQIALTGPPIMMDLMAELAQASEGSLKSWTRDAWDRILAHPGFMVVPVLLAFIPGGIILGILLTAYQIYRAGDNYVAAVADSQNALANAPIAGYDAVPEAQGAVSATTKDLLFQLVTLPLMTFGTVQQVRAYRIQRAQRQAFTAIQEAYRARQAFRQALDDAIPGGRLAAVGTVANPRTILRRIDTRWLAEHPRAGVPGDERFFVDNGLEPQLTIRTGAYTFHVTAPFRGDGGHLAIIAFQEFADGKVVPRTFYRSGEHGLWRVATSRGEKIEKGFKQPFYMEGGKEIDLDPERIPGDRVVEFRFVNEHVSDLAAELQGPLSRWANGRDPIVLTPEAADRAFNGHLEQPLWFESPAEFGLFTRRIDIDQPFSLSDPGNMPDIAAGPLDTWTLPHPDYGQLQAGLFRSQDGRTLFIVMRDSQGRTFVSSIQDAEAGLTPFGTRTDAYRAGSLIATPIAYRGQTVGQGQSIVGRPENYQYVNDLGYRNDLNALFEKMSLEPRPASVLSYTSPSTAPAVGLTAAQAQRIIDQVHDGYKPVLQSEKLPELDEIISAARADSVSDARIEAVLAVPRSPIRWDFVDRIEAALMVERANARGAVIFVSDADQAPQGAFTQFSNGSQASSVRVKDSLNPYLEIGAKAALEDAGKPQIWTAEQADIVRNEILPGRAELSNWYYFEAGPDGQGIVPLFTDEQIATSLDNLFGPNATRTPQISAPPATPPAPPAPPLIASPGLHNALDTRPPPGSPGAAQPPDVRPVRTPVRAGDTQAGNLGRPLVDDPNATRPPPDTPGGGPTGTRVDPGQTRIDPGQTRIDPGQTRIDPGQKPIDPNATLPPPGSPAAPPRPDAAGTAGTPVRAGDTQAGNLGRPLATPPVDDPNATLPPPGVAAVTPATPGVGPGGPPVRAGDTQAGNLGRPLPTPPVDDPNATLPPPGTPAAPPAMPGAGSGTTPVRAGDTQAGNLGRPLGAASAVDDSSAAPTAPGAGPTGTRIDPGQTRIDPGQTRIMSPNQVYTVSGLESPFDTAAGAAFDERTLLTGALERARINGALLREDGAAIARLAGQAPPTYFRAAERRGFIADRTVLPEGHGGTGAGRLIPLIETLERQELERYFSAYLQGRIAGGPGTVGVPLPPSPPAASEDRRASVIFTSLGKSSGTAFRMTVVNRGPVPLALRGEGFVLRPVTGVSAKTIEAEVAALAGAGVTSMEIEAYCLEYTRQPPPAGMIFELAPVALQHRTLPVTRIFATTATLRAAGRLQPVAGDPSTPADYFEAVRQWAIWTHEQGFDQAGYTKAFLDHSRRNVETAGLKWSPEVESAFRGLAPGRWEHLQTVLREASPNQ